MIKIKEKYDLIVVGGGTAGCAAAYIAGKLGLSVLLVERNIHLGGSITSGLVIPGMHTSKSQINTEFFESLISELRSMNAQITYEDNPAWFNPELTKIALDNLMLKANVDVLFNTYVSDVTIVNKEIKGIRLTSEMLSVYIATNYIVDSTGNCEIGKLSNCEFLNSENKFQPVSLRFEMAGINMEEFSNWLLKIDNDREVTTVYRINNQVHLSTAYTWDTGKKWALAPYFDDAVANGRLKDSDRNYFQVFSIPNMPSALAFNCPRIDIDNEINPLDALYVSKALVEGRKAIYRIAEFCKIYFEGFEKAYISNIADMLGIRVSNRIRGKYIYSVEDLRSGKTFNSPVLISDYPIDIHSNERASSVLEKTKQDYQLPIESLMSNDIENLYVAGRCLSADFMAQAALRIQPSCFSMGEGVAKHIASLVN